jgi:hypothetical protein
MLDAQSAGGTHSVARGARTVLTVKRATPKVKRAKGELFGNEMRTLSVSRSPVKH